MFNVRQIQVILGISGHAVIRILPTSSCSSYCSNPFHVVLLGRRVRIIAVTFCCVINSFVNSFFVDSRFVTSICDKSSSRDAW